MPRSDQWTKEEWASYMREYRRRNPEKHAWSKLQFKLYRKAEIELRKRHYEEFTEIYQDLVQAARIDGGEGDR